MSFRVQNLGSGSSGNSLLVQFNDATLLVDCGAGKRIVSGALKTAGAPRANPDLVLLSHEHGDHVRSLESFQRARTPIIATAGTLRSVRGVCPVVDVARADQEMSVDCWSITPLAVRHDAAEPVGFSIAAGGHRVTVLTDLGVADPALDAVIADSDLVVLEANHDEAMVRYGPYPAHLKRRILSPNGHLSNRDCGLLLASALQQQHRVRQVWLAHLSTTNNSPALAAETVRTLLARVSAATPVTVMARDGGGQIWSQDQPALTQRALLF